MLVAFPAVSFDILRDFHEILRKGLGLKSYRSDLNYSVANGNAGSSDLGIVFTALVTSSL